MTRAVVSVVIIRVLYSSIVFLHFFVLIFIKKAPVRSPIGLLHLYSLKS